MFKKRLLTLISSLVLIATLFTVQGNLALAATTEARQDELTLCQASGESFVTASIETTSPEWEGANLSKGIAFHDLDGNVIGYLFDVVKSEKAIGYLMVGNSLYNYSVLEAAETISPTIIDAGEAQNIIEANLGIKGITIDNSSLVYLGYNRFYEIYNCGKQTIGLDLRSKEVTEYASLKSSLTPSSEYKADKLNNQNNNTKDFDYIVLQVVIRNMHDIPDCDDNCGPTTGAMISYWWRQVWGCSNLPTWDDDHDELYDLMDCNDWFPYYHGVPPWMFDNGIAQYAYNHGYNNFIGDWCVNRGYDKIQDEIDAARPMGVMFSYTSSYTSWHWCCVKGYDTRGDTDYIVLNDPNGGYESSVDWDAVDTSSVISRIWRS